MIEHRPVSELGGGDLGWLKAKYHFHIGTYGNPAHKSLGNLIVWNDDELEPASGFPAHSHTDLEIITYVREGIVLHKDSLGNEGETRAGDVQVMSAGTGITHAEVSGADQPTKLFQIWLRPRASGGEPRWGSKPFPKSDRAGRFVVLASGFAEDAAALMIRSDARVLGATLLSGQEIVHELPPGRKAYLVVTGGKISLNDVFLDARDGAAVVDEQELRIKAFADAEIVMVDTI